MTDRDINDWRIQEEDTNTLYTNSEDISEIISSTEHEERKSLYMVI